MTAAGKRLSGRLLNASPDGLACLIAEDQAWSLEPAERLVVRVGLGGRSEPFERTGRVVYRVAAQRAGHLRVGIELDPGADQADRQAWAEALREEAPKRVTNT